MADKTLEVGDRAPDFVLEDQTDRKIQLSELRGKKIVLSFHPLAWTPVCATQMQQLDAHTRDLDAHNAVGLGVSVDPSASKAAWAKTLGLESLSLLADFWPHGEVARSFGIFRASGGFSERAVFVIDEQGRVAWKKIYPIDDLPDIEEILKAVASL